MTEASQTLPPKSEAGVRGEATGIPTVAQCSIWKHHKASPDRRFLSIGLTAFLRGHVDVPLLQSAFLELVQRHESLRTTFRETDGQLMGTVHSELPGPIDYVDLREIPEDYRFAVLNARCHEMKGREISLENGPLFRGCVFRFQDDEYVLVLILHHISMDYWSIRLLLHELSLVYNAKKNHRAFSLPALSSQCLEIARQQREWAASVQAKEYLDWWMRTLTASPFPPEVFPLDGVLYPVPYLRVAQRIVGLDVATCRKLRGLCRRYGLQPFVPLLAAWKLALCRWADREDMTVETLAADRPTIGAGRILGAFYNSIHLRTNLGGDPTLREVLDRVARTCEDSFLRQSTRWECLHDRLRELGTDIQVLRRFGFRFNYDPLMHLSLDGADLFVPGTESVPQTPQVVQEYLVMGTAYLMMQVHDDENYRALSLNHAKDLIDARTADALLLVTRFFLEEIGNDCTRRISELDTSNTLPCKEKAQTAERIGHVGV